MLPQNALVCSSFEVNIHDSSWYFLCVSQRAARCTLIRVFCTGRTFDWNLGCLPAMLNDMENVSAISNILFQDDHITFHYCFELHGGPSKMVILKLWCTAGSVWSWASCQSLVVSQSSIANFHLSSSLGASAQHAIGAELLKLFSMRTQGEAQSATVRLFKLFKFQLLLRRDSISITRRSWFIHTPGNNSQQSP